MLRTKSKLLVIIASCLLTACETKITDNKEPVFNNYRPESREYKNKLAEKIIKNQEELTYVFEKYIDDTEIEIIVSGNAFSAHCFVKVNDWKGIEGIKESKGGGYRGAKLDGLQLEVHVLGNLEGEIFVYKDIDNIID